MKPIRQIFTKGFLSTLLLIVGILCYAQQKVIAIPSARISVCVNKTTNLIFPYKIISVDRGNNDLLIQKAKGVDNILQLKAAQTGFEQTNLTVITSDGRLYSLMVDYADEPEAINIKFSNDTSAIEQKTAITSLYNEDDLQTSSNTIIHQKRFLRVHTRNQKIRLNLGSIYLLDSLMWFTFSITNNSQIAYTPKTLRLLVKDKHQAKRTASQETNITPIFKLIPTTVPGYGSEKIIITCEPFTLSNKQRLVIQLTEQNGGRNMTLFIKPHILLNAHLLKIN
ncbi:conjugative transposon protein TraN [Pinibacter aurantiacus]|uniref:Conjugative transposon protein TraN n=1 Tax=Pinibacter aurantiacus TaxID=2851599 RepID=A0A9E2W5E1_9BACT|nr:conjugative transposon protein TraN [Pinibacter aurantiacus]MBV4358804.1 conjugative transposon protein TraN [Pinibacter aurantiacus]